MAHFAELDSRNIVKRVIVVNNNELLNGDGNEVEQNGINFCQQLLGGTWVQTSYNAAFRGCFAGPGMLYDAAQDIFRALTDEELEADSANDDEIIVFDSGSTANDDILLAGSTANDDEIIVLDNDTANDDEMIVLDNGTANDDEAP